MFLILGEACRKQNSVRILPAAVVDERLTQEQRSERGYEEQVAFLPERYSRVRDQVTGDADL